MGRVKLTELSTSPTIGTRFGQWTTTSIAYRKEHGNGNRSWIIDVICDCGRLSKPEVRRLLSNTSKHCRGCAQRLDISNPSISSAKTVWREQYNDGDITFEQFIKISQQKCFYCGDLPTRTRNIYKNSKCSTLQTILNGDFTYNGLDRINSSEKEHNYNNCIPCCYKCNIGKNDQTLEEWIERAHKIAKLHPKNEK